MNEQLIHLGLNQDEQGHLRRDFELILLVASNPRAYLYTPFVRFTEMPGAVNAVERFMEKLSEFPEGTTNFSMSLTVNDCTALKNVLNQLLLGFSRNPNKSGIGVTDNPFWALTMGKVYHAVSGEEHPHLQKEHFNDMVQYRLKALNRDDDNDVNEIHILREMLIT